MNLRILFMVFVLSAALVLGLHGCRQSNDMPQHPTALPPLVVDEDAPLLLEEPAGTPKFVTEAQTKNATCYVCHVNYEEEALARGHAKANIACLDCHGQSIAHKNDENNITPPDRMYPPSEIDPSCRKCHNTHDVSPVKVIRRWKEHRGDNKTDLLCKDCHDSHDVPAAEVVRKWQQRTGQKKEAEPIVCTDCHHEHRLKLRTVRWDKRTGKLLRRSEHQ